MSIVDTLREATSFFDPKPDKKVLARIVEAPNVPGTSWKQPFTLQVQDLSGWRVFNRYPTRRAAQQAAANKGWTLVSEK